MGRLLRVVVPGCPHHVTQRGNQSQDVFFCDEDRRTYLRILSTHSQRRGLRILAFCLMTNHVHLLAVPERPDSLQKAIGVAHQEYARWLHIRQQLTGHVWQGRFHSCPLDEAHLQAALLYVETNPVRAGLVQHAPDWPWSTAEAHRAGRNSWGFLDFAWWSDCVTGRDPGWWGGVLETGFEAAATAERLRAATHSGRPVGSPPFLDALEVRTGRPLANRSQVPRQTIAVAATSA